jgi:hypothetical protein
VGSFYPKARDKAEAPIVAALRAAGASVELLDSDRKRGIPDLLVGFKGRTLLVEVKNPESTKSEKRNRNGVGKALPTALSEAQERWHAGWRGRRPVVVRTPAEALAALAAVNAPTLTDVVRAATLAAPQPCDGKCKEFETRARWAEQALRDTKENAA